MAGHAIYDAATKSRDSKSMLEENDDIREMHQNDPRSVNRMFSTLRTFAPEFSADPTVAGAYMRRMVGNPMGVGEIVTHAIAARHKMLGGGTDVSQGIGSAMMQGAQKGMAPPGCGKPFKDSAGFMRAEPAEASAGRWWVRRGGGRLGRSNDVRAMRVQEGQEGPGEGSPCLFKPALKHGRQLRDSAPGRKPTSPANASAR